MLNIFSGETGFGAALTNPTELAKRKGMLSKSYPVMVEQHRFPDAESAYQFYKRTDTLFNDQLMTAILARKLLQHPDLFHFIESSGGVSFIEKCTHITNSNRVPRSSWEGVGLESRFIKALVRAYLCVKANTIPSVTEQAPLF